MSIEGFSLRDATEDDIGPIHAIERRVHPAPWSEQAIWEELDKPYSRVLVMTDDETDTQIAGYVVFWMMGEACEILNIAVDLPFRGRGMAKALLRKTVDLALQQKMKRVVLNVRKSNEAAIQLYQNLGFAVVHLRKRFYSNGEDAYEMALLFTDNPISF